MIDNMTNPRLICLALHSTSKADLFAEMAAMLAADGRTVVADSAFREADGGRPVIDGHCLAEFLTQPGGVARCGDPHAGHDAEHHRS